MPRWVLMKGKNDRIERIPEKEITREEKLQEELRKHPDLIPSEDLGLGPLMVVGREATTESGSIDLLAVDREGNLVVVEFKRGASSHLRRRVVAQLLDYGAALWSEIQTYEDFESQVFLPYLRSERCKEEKLKGCASLEQAARFSFKGGETPSVESEEEGFEFEVFKEGLSRSLSNGEFVYLVVATRIGQYLRKLLAYMSQCLGVSMHAVEIDYFASEGEELFVPRAVTFGTKPVPGVHKTSKEEFLEKASSLMGQVFERTLGFADTRGFFPYYGSTGVSIRVPFDEDSPASIIHMYPDGRYRITYLYWHQKDVPKSLVQKSKKKMRAILPCKAYGKYGDLQIQIDDSFQLRKLDPLFEAIADFVRKAQDALSTSAQ